MILLLSPALKLKIEVGHCSWEDLDAAVQEFVNNLRAANGVVNRLVVMGAAEGIISHHDVSKLSSHGGHIEITKSWANHYSTEWGSLKEGVQHLGKVSLA